LAALLVLRRCTSRLVYQPAGTPPLFAAAPPLTPPPAAPPSYFNANLTEAAPTDGASAAKLAATAAAADVRLVSYTHSGTYLWNLTAAEPGAVLSAGIVRGSPADGNTTLLLDLGAAYAAGTPGNATTASNPAPSPPAYGVSDGVAAFAPGFADLYAFGTEVCGGDVYVSAELEGGYVYAPLAWQPSTRHPEKTCLTSNVPEVEGAAYGASTAAVASGAAARALGAAAGAAAMALLGAL
jgi:hypothetical protein